MKKNLIYVVAFMTLGLSSCTDDDGPHVKGKFDEGVFVSNEGIFGQGDGSLSFINPSGEVSDNVFAAQNDGARLGDVVQSLYLTGDQLFIVVNNSNKVEVVDTDSLFVRYTITGVGLPRYMTSQENKGYLTEWVSYSDPGAVVVFDLETGEVSNTITTDYGAEGLLIVDGKLFVANNFSATLSVIDLGTEEVLTNVYVGNGPALMVLDSDGDIWLACSGGYDENYNPANDGKLVELDVDDYSIKQEIEIGSNISGKIAIDPQGESVYYSLGNAIYQVDVNTAESTLLVEESSAVSFYGIGVDESGAIYAADAKSFAENGAVFVYNPSGVLEATYSVGGIGPNGFAFK